MKIVIDTNILFSYFWKNSIIRQIINKKLIDLYTPQYAIEEITKYKKEIINKTKIQEKEFNKLLKEIKNKVKIVLVNEYKKELNLEIFKTIPDKNDIDFLALAYKYNKILWSNDRALKQQDHIIIFNTKEILEILKKLNIDLQKLSL